MYVYQCMCVRVRAEGLCAGVGVKEARCIRENDESGAARGPLKKGVCTVRR